MKYYENEKQMNLNLEPNYSVSDEYLKPNQEFINDFYNTIRVRFEKNAGLNLTFIINYLEKHFEELRIKFNASNFEELYDLFIIHLSKGFEIYIKSDENKVDREILEIAYSDHRYAELDEFISPNKKKEHYNYYANVVNEYINDYMEIVKEYFKQSEYTVKKAKH